MERNELFDLMIKNIFNEYTSFVSARFKDQLKPVSGTLESQPEVKMAFLSGEDLAKLSRVEQQAFYMVSVYMVGILEPFEEYLQEYHQGAHTAFESIAAMVNGVYEANKDTGEAVC